MRIISFLVALFLMPVAASAAPDFNRFAFSLEIKDLNETYQSGSGCLVRSGKTTYYITARHILGELPDQQRAAALRKFTVVSSSNSQIRFSPAELVPVPGAKNLTKSDLMVFKMKPNPLMARYEVTVSPTAPVSGEIVYLVTSLPDRPVATRDLRILDANEEQVNYEKIPGVLKYTGASGGPILNQKGQLVGTYTGRSLIGNGNENIRHLFGTPYLSISTLLPPPSARP